MSNSSDKVTPTSVLGCWRRLCDRTDHRTRAGLVESHGSVLVIKKAALLKCDGKSKQKHSVEAPRNGEVGENKTDGKGSIGSHAAKVIGC